MYNLYNSIEYYINIRDQKIIDIWTKVNNAKANKIYPWIPYPIHRIRKIWNDYVIYKIIKDEKGIIEISENFINKIALLDATTILTGHTTEDPSNILEDLNLVYDESIMTKLYYYMCDSTGTLYISDYGLTKLQNLAIDLINSDDIIDKLLILDQILNVTHQRSDLSSWFIKGGRQQLDILSGK